MGTIMKDNDKVLTRSQRKKLEIEQAELSFLFLKATISRSILKYLYEDIKKQGERFKIESYLRKLGKELKTKEIELQVEYDDLDPKNLSENQQLYIGSVEITNEFFKDIIKEILRNKKKKGFSILKHLKKRIKDEEENYKTVSKQLTEINNKLKGNKKKNIMNSEKDDIDEKGNIKDLIDYSDDEDFKVSEKQIREYGRYVHRLKGKELDRFVNKEMRKMNSEVKKTKRKKQKEESEEKKKKKKKKKKKS